MVQVNANVGLWPADALVKDVNGWAEVMGSILRVHCTYMVRLWRKTKHNSKCFGFILYSKSLLLYFHNFKGNLMGFNHSTWPRTEVIQGLKDVLNTLYPAAEPVAEPNGEAADGGSTGESQEGASAPGSTEGSMEGAAGSTDPTEGSGSAMDVMETLPYPMVEDAGQQEWPPCPWIPKTSLRRWRQPKQSTDTRPNDHVTINFYAVWKQSYPLMWQFSFSTVFQMDTTKSH